MSRAALAGVTLRLERLQLENTRLAWEAGAGSPAVLRPGLLPSLFSPAAATARLELDSVRVVTECNALAALLRSPGAWNASVSQQASGSALHVASD